MSRLPDTESGRHDTSASLSSGRPERTGHQSRRHPHPARPFTDRLRAERHGNFAHHSRAVRCCAQALATPSSPSAPRSCTAGTRAAAAAPRPGTTRQPATGQSRGRPGMMAQRAQPPGRCGNRPDHFPGRASTATDSHRRAANQAKSPAKQDFAGPLPQRLTLTSRKGQPAAPHPRNHSAFTQHPGHGP
jgi:hypothetical protein